jgi:hypothetical protein
MRRLAASPKAGIKTKIIKWLTEERLTYQEEQNEYADFALNITFEGSKHILAICEKQDIDSIILVTVAHITPLDKRAFARLQNPRKKQFYWGIVETLMPLDVQISFIPRFDTLEGVQIMKRIFFDALTKQMFFDSFNEIIRATNGLSVNYSKYLTPRNNQPFEE